MKKWLGLLCIHALLLYTLGCKFKGDLQVNWFTGKDAKLEAALDANDVTALHSAVQQGANVNAHGRLGVTPLSYALGHEKKRVYLELLRMHANPNQRDVEKDNAVTLAVRSFDKDPDYLDAALKAGGDPNTIQSDNNPILAAFALQHNLGGMRMVAKAGGDINAQSRIELPILLSAALANDWDVVWLLLQMGARFDYLSGPTTIQTVFRGPEDTPSSAPLYPDKKKAWDYITQRGIQLPPLE